MQKSGPLIRGKIRRVLNKAQTVSSVLLQTKFAVFTVQCASYFSSY